MRECCSACAFHSHPATRLCIYTLPCLAPSLPVLGLETFFLEPARNGRYTVALLSSFDSD